METMTSSSTPPVSAEPDNYDEFSMHQDLLFSDSLKVGFVPYLYVTSNYPVCANALRPTSLPSHQEVLFSSQVWCRKGAFLSYAHY